jgi:endonuclease/exonuclease/phosphatase family metal-dependent hydrolase
MVLCGGVIGSFVVIFSPANSETSTQTVTVTTSTAVQSTVKTVPILEPKLGECSNARTTYRFMSWNMGNFGKSKSDDTVETMADIITKAEVDLVAGQEVSTDYPGPQAVARLQQALSRKGSLWDSIHSDSTLPKNSSSERYSYWFKSSKFGTNRRDVHLVADVQTAIEREPFTTTFVTKAGYTVRVFQIHTVPTKKGPLREVEALKASLEFQNEPMVPVIFSGDFNLSPKETDPVLETLGFRSHIRGLTSLKKTPKDGQYLFRQYDNIYTRGKITVCFAEVIDFTKRFPFPISADNFQKARAISDHLPVVIGFQFYQ